MNEASFANPGALFLPASLNTHPGPFAMPPPPKDDDPIEPLFIPPMPGDEPKLDCLPAPPCFIIPPPPNCNSAVELAAASHARPLSTPAGRATGGEKLDAGGATAANHRTRKAVATAMMVHVEDSSL